MKKLLSFTFTIFLCVGIAFGQNFPKVKVTFKNGIITKGSKARLTDESVSFSSGGTQKTYDLSEVLTVQAKEGKAGKYALYSGGGCLGIGLLVSLTQGGEYNEISEETYDTGTLLIGSVLWAGIFAGAGALVGVLTDSYQNVYISKHTALFQNFNLNMQTNQANRYNPTKYNLTLSYKF